MATMRYVGERSPEGTAVMKVGSDLRAVPLPMRLDLRRHSPTGLEWGYAGSGPAQLALAILADAIGEQEALGCYQDFKFHVISGLPHDGWELSHLSVEAWYERNRPPGQDGVLPLPSPAEVIADPQAYLPEHDGNGHDNGNNRENGR